MSYLFQACRHAEYVKNIAQAANANGFHFGAIIFKGKDVISVGWCQCKTHPRQARYMRYAKPGKRNNSFLHAEVHALVTAKGNSTDCDMIIARWAEERLKDSYPCGACAQAITVAGIKRIWYWKDGELIHKDV